MALLRERGAPARVTNIELFFDLVFVFAVTQLSHGLLAHLTAGGAVQTLMLFLAVWWLWIFTSWVTNWLDPDKTPVRLALFALMLAGLVLSASIPHAFESMGLAFALAHAGSQVGRSLFMIRALGRDNPGNRRNFQRITVWLLVAAAFWIAGGLAAPEPRLALWAVALAIEYAGPSAGFAVPGLGRSTTADWDVEGHHLSERCSLFVIIALGESILVTGATFADLAWGPAQVAAFLAALVGSIAMWWIYFDTGAERGSHHIAASDDPGRLARLGYTYLHGLIIAGIIVCAVADELALVHPDGHEGHIDFASAAAILGGPALYLLGNTLFKATLIGHPPLSHLAGFALLALLALAAAWLTPLWLALGTSAALVVVAGWETASWRRGASVAQGH
ncbi:low temperature requirement protein A [Labrys wisconsinensis]|uniref:Low temperature requirement protein LtrA n=1 Tax=Labrys wisconsinensis TaxID=425677 RepID=A0ABU0JK95_9HYPH|nr:low temperature requirement protein A [Labrys wisconsinensis]MDQ0474694.1 low temperature requirement protein LtrA [Labrys wisconsinensis]